MLLFQSETNRHQTLFFNRSIYTIYTFPSSKINLLSSISYANRVEDNTRIAATLDRASLFSDLITTIIINVYLVNTYANVQQSFV